MKLSSAGDRYLDTMRALSSDADKPYTFLTSCVGTDGSGLQEMKDEGSKVTIHEFALMCDLTAFKKAHNYDDPEGLQLEEDWHVAYFRSWYKGQPCYFLVWSAIEYIWVEEAA